MSSGIPNTIKILLPTFSSEMVEETKELIIYPDRPPASILHDYTKASMTFLEYKISTVENAFTPCCCVVYLDGVEKTTGYGKSKMASKHDAAKKYLEDSIPLLKDYWNKYSSKLTTTFTVPTSTFEIYKTLQEVLIEDRRVVPLLNQLNEISPYNLLCLCLKRNFGRIGHNDIEETFIIKSDGWRAVSNCKLIVGFFEAEATGPTKHMAREYAAQSILKKMHPYIKYFDGILELYGSKSPVTVKLEQSETELQSVLSYIPVEKKTKTLTPNYELLDKLKKEMMKHYPSYTTTTTTNED